MSTKIYHGYKINGVYSLRELHRLLNPFRQKVEAAAQQMFMQKVASQAVQILDTIAIGGKISSSHARDWVKMGPKTYTARAVALFDAFDSVCKAIKSSARDPMWDLGCAVTILPVRARIHSKTEDLLLALLHADQKEYAKLWGSLRGVEEWPYWDNTDPPEDIPYREWRRRGRIWDQALWNHDTPNVSGYVVECLNAHNLKWPEPGDCYRNQPKYRDRLKFWTHERMLRDWLCKNKHGKLPKTKDVSTFLQYSRSPQAKPIRVKVRAKLSLLLKRRYTTKDFKEEFGPDTVVKDGEEAKKQVV
jgi:hypothetical protein